MRRRFVFVALLYAGAAPAQTQPGPLEALLSWTPGVGGAAPTEFRVERKPVACGTSGSYTLHATVPATTTQFLDKAITIGNSYCYRVKAANAVGESPPSNEAGKGFLTPTAPTGTTVQ
jgi:hypothetical protein